MAAMVCTECKFGGCKHSYTEPTDPPTETKYREMAEKLWNNRSGDFGSLIIQIEMALKLAADESRKEVIEEIKSIRRQNYGLLEGRIIDDVIRVLAKGLVSAERLKACGCQQCRASETTGGWVNGQGTSEEPARNLKG